MKIFIAGATGVLGRLLIPKLVQEGHEVVGMTHHKSNMKLISDLGAVPAVADALNQSSVQTVLELARPDMVIHQLTSLGSYNLEDNAEIRMVGTRNLVEASKSVNVKKMIAQSISWAYEPGDKPANEQVSLDIHAALPRKTTIDGIVALEEAVAEIPNHIILRYGAFYGPATWYERNGRNAVKVMNKEIPATDGISSFIHIHDAAQATVQAIHWPTGPVNIVDDEPAPGVVWLPLYASAIGAPMPDLQEGRNACERGASNRLAREDYKWQPMFPSWRDGFKHI
ncbi:NAD-dependent epimerase/dehydratase family protein [Paenibacillus pini]|uniref:Zn-dependent alcohol dehydrogenases n=1 Tax=Paenibacillus pini JCM 16418 TaxID=1236976 RepID=W7YZ14_9BACL|nr:NAD(P)-dependent oxidoreductase [Paenibacillus pini]GAF07619.1 Zn-dependent alcohol dehydrogenases [Paenibacillus pini JCM 16418]